VQRGTRRAPCFAKETAHCSVIFLLCKPKLAEARVPFIPRLFVSFGMKACSFGSLLERSTFTFQTGWLLFDVSLMSPKLGAARVSATGRMVPDKEAELTLHPNRYPRLSKPKVLPARTCRNKFCYKVRKPATRPSRLRGISLLQLPLRHRSGFDRQGYAAKAPFCRSVASSVGGSDWRGNDLSGIILFNNLGLTTGRFDEEPRTGQSLITPGLSGHLARVERASCA
jgi:hypothetical protein